MNYRKPQVKSLRIRTYSPGYFPNPRTEPRSPALQADSLPAEPQGNPKNTGVGSLSLLQWIQSLRINHNGKEYFFKWLYVYKHKPFFKMAICIWVTWLYSRDWHNIVNKLYSLKKLFFKKRQSVYNYLNRNVNLKEGISTKRNRGLAQIRPPPTARSYFPPAACRSSGTGLSFSSVFGAPLSPL